MLFGIGWLSTEAFPQNQACTLCQCLLSISAALLLLLMFIVLVLVAVDAVAAAATGVRRFSLLLQSF